MNEIILAEARQADAGKADLGAAYPSRKATATRAYELAEWLEQRPFAGISTAENITGPDWASKLKAAQQSCSFTVIGDRTVILELT
ncbi:hypothetical protein [Paraburkholderia dipogonis]|uniref:hypothetical protein n=1 Tax=Paraburkholderia dipogonis TaxID=1211383 RepID=UPI0038B747BB